MLLFVLFLVLDNLVGDMPNVVWYLWRKRRDEARLNKLEALAETYETEPAILVRGRVVELLEFAHLPDVAFEPRFFRVRERKYGMSAETRIVRFVVLAILVVSMFLLLGKPCALVFSLVMAVVWVMLFYSLFSKPTYYRVVPGRIDIMSFRTFGEQPERVRSLSLRETQICIDLTRTKCFVTLEGHGLRCEFDRAGTGNPLGFAMAVALGAKSTSPAPNIPMDALLG